MRVTAEKIEQQTGLIPIENVDAVALFTGGGLDALLQQIEAEVTDAPTDTSTERTRKEIASLAYKVSRSKVVIDDAGKTLVAEWKKKSAEVDAGRKKARDTLDALRDKVRQPLTDWEAEQARIEEEKRLAIESEKQAAEAARLAEIERREAAIREAEEKIARQEAERLEKERQAQAEADRKAREENIKREAEERGRLMAENALKRAEEAKARAEQQAKEAAEKAERDKQAAIEAERQKAARDAAERERHRRAEEEQKRRQEAARAADKANRDRINGEIVAAFAAEGIPKATACEVLALVAAGSIPHVRITY